MYVPYYNEGQHLHYLFLCCVAMVTSLDVGVLNANILFKIYNYRKGSRYGKKKKRKIPRISLPCLMGYKSLEIFVSFLEPLYELLSKLCLHKKLSICPA